MSDSLKQESADQRGLVLNRAAALERMGGDTELYDEILILFLDDTPKQLELLVAALERDDRVVAQRQAHSLKSAAGNVGGDRMMRCCLEFEKNALTAEHSSLRSKLEEILLSFKEIVAVATA